MAGHVEADYVEALRDHSNLLKRKSLDEQQTRERAELQIPTLQAEASELLAEAEALQQELESERLKHQEFRARHEQDKSEVAVLKREATTRRVQIDSLSEELARSKKQLEAQVCHALVSARKAALEREAEIETARSYERAGQLEILRLKEAAIEEAEQNVEEQAAEMRSLPKRAASVQLVAMLEKLGQLREVRAQQEAQELQKQNFLKLRERQLTQHAEELRQLEVDTEARRKGMAEQRVEDEEETKQEEQELRERITRNTRRAEHAERKAAAHLKAMRQEEEANVKRAAAQTLRFLEEEATATAASAMARSQQTSAPLLLPKVAPRDLRPGGLHLEFPVIGHLKALDQAIRGLEPIPARRQLRA